MEDKFQKTENVQEEVIGIKGMHCKSCAELIETKLKLLKGVEKAKVSYIEEKAFIAFDKKQVNFNDIKREIESSGYKVSAVDTTVDNKLEKIDFGEVEKEIESSSYEINNKNDSEDVEPKKSRGIKQGIIYGLIPHTGCIAFIVATIFGVTAATEFFKPLLLNPYFFYILIGLSFTSATISALVYLKKQDFIIFRKVDDGTEISFSEGIIRRKWKYLSTLYGTTIGVNLLLFMVIFPLLANVSLASSSVTGALLANINPNSISSLNLKVDIPCSGHAPLISDGLKSINGVISVQFSLPNIFDVKYDSSKTTKEQILALDVFNTYKATVLSESYAQSSNSNNNQVIYANNNGNSNSNLATVTNGVQVIQLSVQGANYYPNPIRVKKDIPVQLIADINNMPGCSKSIVIPEFGITKSVSTSDNKIEFTPSKSGTFQFSCSMGMYLGQIIVEEVDGSVAAYTGSTPVTSGGSCGGSSGGCGCGG
ncbi:hypothetical protein A3K64_03795 [Candidatus Micrarchaeota archaeon RBG_16_36_9]|nr:MAG: hypothetical protein A3K64_03795 [Candidatus Micrarchaeota archaeon RBG_16_36_9]